MIYPMKFLLIGSILAVLSGAYNGAGTHDFFRRHFGEESPKSAKGSRENIDGKESFVSIISAYSSDLKRTLGIEGIETGKESEIGAVRKVIEKLKLKGVIMTGDALHATTETMKLINESENKYILQIKKNRPSWHEECERICSQEAPEDEYRSIEKNKGRVEIRKISVYSNS